jgi:glucose/arabinose dehydrogenase
MAAGDRRRTVIVIALMAVLVIAGLGVSVFVLQSPNNNAGTGNQAPVNNVTLRLVADGLAHPVRAVSPPDGSRRLFIVDQIGKVWIVASNGTMLKEPFIDVSGQMVAISPSYDERGLLGFAFHPDFRSNGKFYLYYSAPLDPTAPVQWDHTNILAEFKVSSDPNRGDMTSERMVLKSNNPYSNHNGGDINFGPDGYLYLPLGDGGNGNDVGMGHSDIGNGQDLSNVLGKVLRIDVNQNSSVSVTHPVDQPDGNIAYGVPADNPFVSGPGRDEIYAYGLRNPAFATFDTGGNHSYFIGNAGQNLFEGVFLVEKGQNCGWPIKENGHCFNRINPNDQAAVCTRTTGYLGEPLVDPIISLSHGSFPSDSIAVVGGRVYRGSDIPGLQGGYLFGMWKANSVVWVAFQNGTDWSYRQLGFSSFLDRNGTPVQGIGVPAMVLPDYLLGFGLGPNQEMYLLTSGDPGPTGSSGKVWKIAPDLVSFP